MRRRERVHVVTTIPSVLLVSFALLAAAAGLAAESRVSAVFAGPGVNQEGAIHSKRDGGQYSPFRKHLGSFEMGDAPPQTPPGVTTDEFSVSPRMRASIESG